MMLRARETKHQATPDGLREGLVPPVTSALAAVPASQNILTDSGIENGGDKPDNWEQGAAIDGVTYFWCKSEAFEGKASLCIEKTAERDFPIAQWLQTVNRQGDRPALRVSAQVKADKMTKAVLDVLFLDEHGNWVSHKWAAYIGSKAGGDPPASHDWKLYCGTVPIPKEAKKICIGLQVYGPGKVWFDDVRAGYADTEDGADVPAAPKHAADEAKKPRIGTDQIVVEDLALQMIVAIREKDDKKLRSFTSDRIKGWPAALPVFAVELREHYRQNMGDEKFDLRASESLVEGDLAAVRCTGPKELKGKCLVLFFVKSEGHWLNYSLRASMENMPLAEQLGNFRKQVQEIGAAKAAR